MIAIVGSYFLVVYIFLPEYFFRKFAPNFQDTVRVSKGRYEEILSKIGPCIWPILIANFLSHISWFVGHWPLPIQENLEGKYNDYQTVISSLWSDAYFHEHLTSTWAALNHVAAHQARFLFWMYSALLAEILCVVLLTYYFGSLSRHGWYRWTFGKLLLRRASHWKLLLTGFVFPRRTQPVVIVDALTSDDRLYSGAVGDYFLKPNGELSGILLKQFKRFKRSAFEKDREAGLASDPAAYWKEIPGANFYLPADKIANLNIRYEIPQVEIIRDVERILKNMKIDARVSLDLTSSYADKPPKSTKDPRSDQEKPA